MYKKRFNFFHGIMFHHFHDKHVHKKGQGSIDKNDLIKIIKYIGRENILDADVFIKKYLNNTLKRNEVCFTFDDGIKSQFDVALPVLNEFKIKSFFFVYSSLFTGKPDYLEVYRYFRLNFYKSINEFYFNFFKYLNFDLKNYFSENHKIIINSKYKFPHYSINDIKFRLVRDKLLNPRQYKLIMSKLFKIKRFNPKKYLNHLYINKENLKIIKNDGHIIGLHSHSHPTLIEKLSYESQAKEYKQNILTLSKILNQKRKDFISMSHPCGSYNENTKKILKKLGIKLGFKQVMLVEKEKNMTKVNNSNLEIARQDHADIMKIIKG